MLSLLSQHSVFFPFMLVFLRFLSLFLCKDKDLLILDDLSRTLDWNLRIHRPHIHSNCLLFATLIKSPDMGSNLNSVHYCCVSRDSQILYAYNNARNQRNESLAALCLEKTPPFHKWYFETMSKKTFGFLMGDGFVYFVIVDDVFRRSSVLDFLENLRDEFKKANKKHLRGSLSGSNVEDQLVRRLIASLEADLTCLPISSPSIDGAEQKSDTATSTKAPLLGRSNKQGKKKGRDHVNSLRGIEIEENRKSNDRGNVTECSDSSSAAATTHVPRRRSTGSQNIERKWQRQVQIILAIDAAICLLLLGVWLAICQGIECTRS